MKIFKTSGKRLVDIVIAAIVAGVAGKLVWLLWFPHGLPSDVRAAQHSSQNWTLVSIDGVDDERTELNRKDRLHGFRVLGRLPLTDARPVIEAVNLIDRGKTYDSMAMCFFPRHILEGHMEDGRNLEIIICYQCGNVEVWVADEPIDRFAFRGCTPDTLNGLLTAGKIPLPPQPGQ